MHNSPTIDLRAAPSVLFLFGLAGAGKNYVGDLLAGLSGRYVYHADCDLTPAMHEAIRRGAGFTDQMRNDFFTIVAQRISELRYQHGPLIVTQAAYKQRHRDYISDTVGDVEFVHIVAPDEVIAARLRSRGDLITPEFSKVMRAHFELPEPMVKSIDNSATQDNVLVQLVSLY